MDLISLLTDGIISSKGEQVVKKNYTLPFTIEAKDLEPSFEMTIEQELFILLQLERFSHPIPYRR